MLISTYTKIRQSDPWGQGHYKASRGKHRSHNGVDFCCDAGECIESICEGVITKIGYPYSQHMPPGMSDEEREKRKKKASKRYVQVTDKNGFNLRYFYVKTDLKVGDKVSRHDIVGTSQGIEDVYPGITEHIHFEIKKGSNFYDPIWFLRTYSDEF